MIPRTKRTKHDQRKHNVLILMHILKSNADDIGTGATAYSVYKEFPELPRSFINSSIQILWNAKCINRSSPNKKTNEYKLARSNNSKVRFTYRISDVGVRYVETYIKDKKVEIINGLEKEFASINKSEVLHNQNDIVNVGINESKQVIDENQQNNIEILNTKKPYMVSQGMSTICDNNELLSSCSTKLFKDNSGKEKYSLEINLMSHSVSGNENGIDLYIDKDTGSIHIESNNKNIMNMVTDSLRQLLSFSNSKL